MHRSAGAQQRQGDDSRSGGDRPARSRPVLDDLAAELVPHDHLLLGAHEVLIARLARDLGQLVAVLARMQVRSADAAAQHVDEDLPRARPRLGPLDDRQPTGRAADRPHAPAAGTDRRVTAQARRSA